MSVNQEYGLISKLFKSRKNLLNQLGINGYNVTDYQNFSINEINVLDQQDKQDMLMNHTRNGGSVYVKYSTDKALRPQTVHDLVEDLVHLENVLQPKSNDCLIIVAKDSANDTLTNLLIQLYANEGIFVNIISLAELQFNIMNHSLVPKHEKLTLEETEEVKKVYNIESNKNFPEISRFDPLAKITCLQPGEVCKITRPCATAIESTFYRICINK